jgi:hypothetical protein
MNQPNKKIFGVPLEVARRVNQLVNTSNDTIIELVLEHMAIKAQQLDYRQEIGVNEGWHQNHRIVGLYNRGCGCLYCNTVHLYISTKVSAHRLRRRIDDYDWCRPAIDTQATQQLRLLEQEWPHLRELSHQIRDLAGL